MNRFIKTDEDLLLEQAEFLKSPRAGRVVNSFFSTHNSERFNYYEHIPSPFKPAVSPTVMENPPPSEGTCITSDELTCEGVGQPPVALLGENINDPFLLRAASRISSGDPSNKPKVRSLFAKQLLAAKHVAVKDDFVVEQPSKQISKLTGPLQQLADSGPITIRRQQGLAPNEIVRIHENNIDLLSQLSNEEILTEREAIISSADPKVISFLMHKKALRHGVPQGEAVGSDESSKDSQATTQLDTDSLLASLGVNPDPSIPHMNVVEPEKLAWMQDLPYIAKAPTEDVKSADTSKALKARFGLDGCVIPPDANLPVHLGLHHHGDEPERGGYTIDEMFHLASSSHPAQRRLAISSLAAALAVSRCGHHATLLQTPSLLSSLLLTRPTGICFLLRWALDQCVTEATCASAVIDSNSGAGGGVSISLISECLRALNNLLVDNRGEALLDESFDWSVECRRSTINLVPSEMAWYSHKFRLQAEAKEADVSSDHVKAMATDPVGCLFFQTTLAARIGWMLSPGPALRLPPDVVAYTIPGLLLTAVRHSSAMALSIFKTPHLIDSLMEHFLPISWSQQGTTRPPNDQLTGAYGVPHYRILKLMRVLAQRSSSLRVVLVNKWCLVERCLAYLLHRLPTSLPLQLRVLLQLESLRCLTVCLEEPQSPAKVADLIKVSLDKLVGAAQAVMDADKVDDCLRIGWLSFFANAVVQRFKQHLSSNHLKTVCTWAKQVAESITSNEYALGVGVNVGWKAYAPALIAVTVRLLKIMDMQELTTLRKRIFSGSQWSGVFNHFIRCQSVLTGFPKATPDADVVVPYTSAPCSETDPGSTITTDTVFALRENNDLSTVTVSSAPPCLPDLGMACCVVYRGNSWINGELSTTPITMWWPPSTHSSHRLDIVEPVHLVSLRAAKWPSFLPLVEAALDLGDVDLIPWCSRLARLHAPPVMTKTRDRNGSALPHGLIAMEAALMGKYLLSRWNDSKAEDLWWATFHLLPCLCYGQEALFIELLKRIIFPVHDLTPIERSFSVDIATADAPWPPVHESFPRALAFHAHRTFVDYFVELLQGHEPKIKQIYKVLNSRPSCDFILPDDWFYMPLLEAYFVRNRQLTDRSGGKIDLFLDSQADAEAIMVKATVCLGWMLGLLSRCPPPSRPSQPRELSAGEHFSRLCCLVLTCRSAGALCFNASGAIVAEMINLLAPKVNFCEMDSDPKSYLPLDFLSLYDLFTDLLEHYAAVSYSSPVFANLLLLFLPSSVLPPNYRKAFWGEHQAALRVFLLSPSEVLLPATIFAGLFKPLETDVGVLQAYASALCSGLVHPTRQPLASLIALHHLNRNIYQIKTNSELDAFLQKFAASLRFLSSRDSKGQVAELIDWLRRYKQPGEKKTLSAGGGRLSGLVQSTYVASSRDGCCVKSPNLIMQLYEEAEMPPSRIRRWTELMGK